MSHQFGFSRTAWNNYERGTSKPALDDFISICRYFDISEFNILHTDLSKRGDLIPKTIESKILKKDDLKGDLKGDLTPEIEESRVSEPEPKMDWGRFKNRIVTPAVITVDSQGNENVLFVPVKARAGYLVGYADREYIHTLPTYRLPGLNNGTYRMFEVEGLSMYDTLHDRDIIIGSFVDQWRVLRDDRVHIVVTKNAGVVVKRVLNRIDKEGKIILKSDNYKDRDLYPPIICDISDVIEIWYGIALISRQMRPPSENYKRLVDLEGRFTLLEESVKKILPKQA